MILSPQDESFQMIYAMVKHFQKLFNLRSLESVYPSMTLLNQQVELSRNVQNRLKDLLKLGKIIYIQQSHVMAGA